MILMNVSGYNFQGSLDPYRGFIDIVAAVYTILDDQSRLLDVGQTEDLNNRFLNHPRQNRWEVNKVGYLHLYILQIANEQTRLQIESLIRKQYNPSCGAR